MAFPASNSSVSLQLHNKIYVLVSIRDPTAEAPRICSSRQLGQSCRSWEPSHASPSLTVIIPWHQPKQWPGSSTPPGLRAWWFPTSLTLPGATKYCLPWVWLWAWMSQNHLLFTLITFTLLCRWLLDCFFTDVEAPIQNYSCRYAQAFNLHNTKKAKQDLCCLRSGGWQKYRTPKNLLMPGQ